MKNYLGIEFGSTRIKAVVTDEACRVISTGDYLWKSDFIGGIWTYSLDEARAGLLVALEKTLQGVDASSISAMGVSGMMHGYLAFDEDWKSVAPFATWQNTMTARAAAELTALFGFNIPQRWSVAHLYQRILNGESHVSRVAHITSLAGYFHFLLTGENVLGAGEASGVFPLDEKTLDYDADMLEKFDTLIADRHYPWQVRDLLPRVLPAGRQAGALTAAGASFIGGLLPVGTRFAPPEGDMGTGMVATNSVTVGTGNISAGTSGNLAVITGKPLSRVYPELDVLYTPAGKPAVLVHAGNCTNDINAWFSVLSEVAALFGEKPDAGTLYRKLFELSLQGEPDCGGTVVYNYMAGEPIAHIDSGKPLVLRRPDAHFTLANFIRAQLYGAAATLRLGIDILSGEQVKISRITGHGGFFKTPTVGQRYMAAACGAPIFCNGAAGEGGPFGMAILAAYLDHADVPLEEYLEKTVFAAVTGTTVYPDKDDVIGFERYMEDFKKGMAAERAAGET